MRILAFSDWRAQPLEMIIAAVKSHNPDVILYAGDDLGRFAGPNSYVFRFSRKNGMLTKLNRPWKGNSFLKNLRVPFYCVNGNTDLILCHEGKHYVRPVNYLSYRGRCYEQPVDHETLNSMVFVPMSFSFGRFSISTEKEIVTVFSMKYSRDLTSHNENVPDGYADIFLSHVPPYGTLDLSASFGVEHIGSRALLKAIKKHGPRLVICGHSHMWGGLSQRIGDTLVINVSSIDKDDSPGNYALIDTNDWSVELRSERNQMAEIRYIRGMDTIGKALNEKEQYEIEEELYDARTVADLYKVLEKVEKFAVNTRRFRERIESREWTSLK